MFVKVFLNLQQSLRNIYQKDGRYVNAILSSPVGYSWNFAQNVFVFLGCFFITFYHPWE